MQQLIAICKLRVEEHRSEYAEDGECYSDGPCQDTGDDQQAAAELKGNDCRQQDAGHAELLQ
jgi:hypothetical protein